MNHSQILKQSWHILRLTFPARSAALTAPDQWRTGGLGIWPGHLGRATFFGHYPGNCDRSAAEPIYAILPPGLRP